ncbi:MAG: VTT domain-containing protein [Thermodesulfobacteriota bacterium]
MEGLRQVFGSRDAPRETLAPLLVEGRNCWRIVPASRASFLVDGAAFLSAFTEAAKNARQSILIAAWDLDTRTRLFWEGGERPFPTGLGEFLYSLVRRRRSLHVYILLWDFSVIYAFERELFPLFNLPWRRHHRIHFRTDGVHPPGSSQHQKIVVVDDAVAFVGGLDLTRGRWDTREHLAEDPRRVGPSGERYGPFHDVQMAVDGAAASALGDLVRDRWFRATGKRIPRPVMNPADPWPPYVVPHLKDMQVGIARTEPANGGREQVREVEALYLDTIAGARKTLYIENQYFTSSAVAGALSERLSEKHGPEVVFVLREKSGWLEDATMGVLRARLMREVRAADRYKRFRVYYPLIEDPGHAVVNVHSKVMVMDDLLVRVGSSNLSNRSMGADSECDLAVEALGQERIKRGIVLFRNGLLGEHLGVRPEEVARIEAQERSLIAAVERLRGPGRTLVPFPEEGISWAGELLPGGAIDPDEPIDPEKLIEQFVPEEEKKGRDKRLRDFAILLAALVGLAAAWRWSPLGEWLGWEAFSAAGAYVRGSPAAPLLVLGAYLAGSLVMFPVTVLILATAFIFGGVIGAIYSFLGCILAAAVSYGIGILLGRRAISRLAGSRLNRVSRGLARHGVLAVTTVRIVPLAPFTVVNLVAGASHIRFRDFLMGSILGLLPGIVGITLFGQQLEAAFREPGLWSFMLLALIAVLLVGAILGVKRRLERQGNPKKSGGD